MNNEKEDLIDKLIEELSTGFESWDSFYSGLSMEQETEQDPTKLYETYITEYITDALYTIQEQARHEGYMEAVEAIKDRFKVRLDKCKRHAWHKCPNNNERDTYHFTKEESRQSTSN